jgi:hypothetical protein
MTNEVFTPSVDTTIFPRINFIKQFVQRANQRAENGRVYGWDYVPFLNDDQYFPSEPGSDCLADLVPFPIDLGPVVTTTPTAIYDLREDCGDPTVYELNPLIPPIDDEEFFPSASGADCLSSQTFPLDVGPDVTSSPVDLYDLRNDCGSASEINLGFITSTIDETYFYPIADGAVSLSTDANFPKELGPNVTTFVTTTFDLRDDDGSPLQTDLNPLN